MALSDKIDVIGYSNLRKFDKFSFDVLTINPSAQTGCDIFREKLLPLVKTEADGHYLYNISVGRNSENQNHYAAPKKDFNRTYNGKTDNMAGRS